jgi:hypothetical protein
MRRLPAAVNIGPDSVLHARLSPHARVTERGGPAFCRRGRSPARSRVSRSAPRCRGSSPFGTWRRALFAPITGDPAAALAHARKALAPDGAVLVVEPNAADDYAANLASPLAALNYAASTFQCTPTALAQPGGVALGAQAGPASVRQLADDAGFSHFRQVTQTPVNVVLELRP